MIKVMMDYDAYPLWKEDGANYNCISETGIIYDEQLKSELTSYMLQWIIHANVLFDEDYETELTWDKVDGLARDIAGCIKELNPEEDVIYFDETSEEWWYILPDNKGAVMYGEM